MKRLLFFLPATCLAAFAASADTYTNVFTGVSSIDENGVPTAIGAVWTTNNVSLAKEDNAVQFETDETILRLDVTASPADTNTIVRLELKATIESVDALEGLGGGAQTAFAVYTNAFHVWNGSGWVVLNEVPAGFDGAVPTNLLAEISYQGESAPRKARFTIGDMVCSVRTNSDQWVILETKANNLAGFGCRGSGKLASADGSVMLGVAEYAGVKYGTLTEAVEKAEAALGGEVDVLRETSENVHITTDGVTIADNGKTTGTITADENVDIAVKPAVAEMESTDGGTGGGASGSYSIPVKVSGGNLTVLLPQSLSNKEIVDGSITQMASVVTFTIQTATSVITNAAPGGKALMANPAALRTFLAANAAGAYNAADVSSTSISNALAAVGGNEIPLYQSYALGISPTTSVKPVSKPGDTAGDAITLQIPGLIGAVSSGDYTPSIKVYKNGVEVPGANTAAGISIPLETGSYTVKIELN